VFFNTRPLVGTIRQQVAACAKSWRAKGVEPKDFNTLESADDIDDLRRALNIEKIDLLAFSYGTRLALAIVQRHGDHVGRVVLQGVNGPGLVVKRPGPVTRKLQRIGTLLKQDASWQLTTDLLAVSQKARMRLAGAPATVTINDQRSGQPIKLQVSKEGFDAIVSLNLDDARLPALLISVAEADDRVLTRFVEAAWNGLGTGKVGLMARAVNCAADRPAARWQLAAREATAAPFGESIDNAFLTDDFCRAVGYDKAPVEFAQPVQSATPVLMLTGVLDATNPIENARDVARGFPNATVLEIENAAHEALTVPAVQDAVVDFLAGKSVRDRRLTAAVPHFASIAEALQPAGRGRGGT
jgi:pimeloyl-ACP methyl ester carboxylesterase